MTITGNIGIDGPLAGIESVYFTMQPMGNTVFCSNNLTVTGGVLLCEVEPGVGTSATLSTTLCGQNVIVENFFSFSGIKSFIRTEYL